MNIPEAFRGFELDHIGVAVHSLSEGFKFYETLGMKVGHIEEVPTEKVRVGMLELSNNSRIELLEPTSPDSAVKKFLDKKGPGIHHICLRVTDLSEKLKTLKKQGVKLIHETPQPGAHNCQIAFVHPHATGGVLLELSEKMK